MAKSVRMWTRSAVLAFSAVLLLAGNPPAAVAADFLGTDCRSCHTGAIGDLHHAMAAGQGLGCLYCHIMQWDAGLGSYAVLTDRNCTNCHAASAHEEAHDNAFFSPDVQASQLCLTCHQETVAEHLARDLTCVTCHGSSDPAVQETITRGSGTTGEPVYCLDCHGRALEPYALHNAPHDAACTGCHLLEAGADGRPIGIHTGAPALSATICIDCHRLGTDDLARNSIFTVPVHAGPAEPPETDYQASLYFNGPCAKCHNNQGHMRNNLASGCLPCHYLSAADSFPTAANDFTGNQVWGHRLQHKIQTGKQAGKPR